MGGNRQGGIAMAEAHTDAAPCGELDREAFERVWRRVMPTDRPDCPFTVDAPERAESAAPPKQERPERPVCLGEGSAAQLPRLEALLAQTVDCYRIYRALYRRLGLPGLGWLAAEKRRQAKRLDAARFLISGVPFSVPPTPAPPSAPAPQALRDRFRAEQRLAAGFFSAAEAGGDACLSELYYALSGESDVHARRLWAMLEAL